MNEGQGFDPGQPPATPEGMIEPKKRGCLFWGCIIALILIVCIGGCITFVAFRGVQMMKEYVSPQPQPVPEYQARPGEYEEVRDKIQAFKRGAEEQPAELVLTADDLNAILTSDPHWRRQKGHAFFRIEGDDLYLDLSQPLTELRSLVGNGYLNATLKLRPAVTDGKATFDLVEATANGKPIHEALIMILLVSVIKELREDNFLENMPRAKSIEVKDGKIVLRK